MSLETSEEIAALVQKTKLCKVEMGMEFKEQAYKIQLSQTSGLNNQKELASCYLQVHLDI